MRAINQRKSQIQALTGELQSQRAGLVAIGEWQQKVEEKFDQLRMARGTLSESLIWQWNCRGFQRKWALVQQYLMLLDEEPLAIALQDTGKAAKFSGYQAFSSARGEKSRVTKLIKRNIVTIEHKINSREIEAVLLEIFTGRKE